MTGVQGMSLMSTHPLRKGWDGHLCVMVSIVTGVQGMSLMSTHPLGTKGWDGQLCVMVRSPRDVLDIHASLAERMGWTIVHNGQYYHRSPRDVLNVHTSLEEQGMGWTSIDKGWYYHRSSREVLNVHWDGMYSHNHRDSLWQNWTCLLITVANNL